MVGGRASELQQLRPGRGLRERVENRDRRPRQDVCDTGSRDRHRIQNAREVGPVAGVLGAWLEDVEHGADPARLVGPGDLHVDAGQASIFQQMSNQGIGLDEERPAVQRRRCARTHRLNGVDIVFELHRARLRATNVLHQR